MGSNQGEHDHPAMRFTTTRLYNLFGRSRSGREQSLSPRLNFAFFFCLAFFPLFFRLLHFPSFNLLGSTTINIRPTLGQRYISLLPRSCFVHCRVCIITPKSRWHPCCCCGPERFFGGKEDSVPHDRYSFVAVSCFWSHITST